MNYQKNISKLLVGIALINSSIIIGCSKKEEVKTVEWYLKNIKQQEEMLERCSNNPGELSETPNCINAHAAMVQASSGPLRELKW